MQYILFKPCQIPSTFIWTKHVDFM